MFCFLQNQATSHLWSFTLYSGRTGSTKEVY